ncbi:hypothetical protein [Pontibacillus litoralis]|uniref:Uncharacterized protein n=1 Tax=Pontibacillus litoralis JSM 072002 TaxID=1385512 RepID=A0A0A5FZH8_9BACI|nr:hypothetical protein [Pontibacillus litoralis]KGX85199.1 hypothetical protein N784_09895 [Pontibacillus litoralis JSM 072002]
MVVMFKYIKGLFNKKEIARIKELEKEVADLKVIDVEKANTINTLEKKLEKLSEEAFENHMTLLYMDKEELEANSHKCSCGGYFIPMYEEHPNWIEICTSCDNRIENTDMSPILEPA